MYKDSGEECSESEESLSADDGVEDGKIESVLVP